MALLMRLIIATIIIHLFMLSAPQQCNRYPKIIGGDSGYATISQIDLYSTKLAVIGSTSDP